MLHAMGSMAHKLQEAEAKESLMEGTAKAFRSNNDGQGYSVGIQEDNRAPAAHCPASGQASERV